MDGNERESLEAPPAAPASTTTSGFDFNNPTIIALLYLASFVVGITAVVGVVLAYVQRDEARPWETSHYEYLIRTFWIGFIGILVGALTMIVLVGFVILPAALVLVIVRSVLSITNAQKHEPMPNPGTWLA
ncbi:DUF4870 family protein [Novosphingobium album (ex Liu et al. 2023)]|uniref:DUF4870 domain-containing protein n=1 Tax=Novosphingobium album (ex Liu et al. 2023) TaxID=3031130 RepID=A0ABT5WXG1_9SPHN|nr:DUF4870 domain-containing protein [Novosphingobium album (ex Liu et al. 2023)]MDE8654582.1 hypothetical protein [Novosphingobium album (ex Liu et al. 2023)]